MLPRSTATKPMSAHRCGFATMVATRREAPCGRRAGNVDAAAGRGAIRWLGLAAAPTFAIMALLTPVLGAGAPDVLCSAAQNASPLSGMVPMYVLMSAFHSAPWLKLICGTAARCRSGASLTARRRWGRLRGLTSLISSIRERQRRGSEFDCRARTGVHVLLDRITPLLRSSVQPDDHYRINQEELT